MIKLIRILVIMLIAVIGVFLLEASRLDLAASEIKLKSEIDLAKSDVVHRIFLTQVYNIRRRLYIVDACSDILVAEYFRMHPEYNNVTYIRFEKTQ